MTGTVLGTIDVSDATAIFEATDAVTAMWVNITTSHSTSKSTATIVLNKMMDADMVNNEIVIHIVLGSLDILANCLIYISNNPFSNTKHLRNLQWLYGLTVTNNE